MKDNELETAASTDLDRILGFFPRVDGKISAGFGIDLGLLGLMALNVRLSDFTVWQMAVPGGLALLLIAASLYFLFRASFPDLDGGSKSLIYFAEIAKLTEANFVDNVCRQPLAARGKDLLGQVWRNSVILRDKYRAVKIAFVLTAIALGPWAMFLAAAAVSHASWLTIN